MKIIRIEKCGVLIIFLMLLLIGCGFSFHQEASAASDGVDMKQAKTSKNKGEDEWDTSVLKIKKNATGKTGIVHKKTGDTIIPFGFENLGFVKDSSIKVVSGQFGFFIKLNGALDFRESSHYDKPEISSDKWIVKSIGHPDTVVYRNWQKSRFKAISKTGDEKFTFQIGSLGIKPPQTYWVYKNKVVFYTMKGPLVTRHNYYAVYDLQKRKVQDKFVGQSDMTPPHYSPERRYIILPNDPKCTGRYFHSHYVRGNDVIRKQLVIYDIEAPPIENRISKALEKYKEGSDRGYQYNLAGVPIHPLFNYFKNTFNHQNKKPEVNSSELEIIDLGPSNFKWSDSEKFLSFHSEIGDFKHLIADLRNGLKDIRYLIGRIPGNWKKIGKISESKGKTIFYNSDRSDSKVITEAFMSPEGILGSNLRGDENNGK